MPVRKLDSGHWQISFKLPGQPRYRKVHREARLKSDAELIELRLKQIVFDSKWNPKHDELFSVFAEKFLAWSKQHKKSYEFDELFISQILPTFGHHKLGQITPELVQTWWAERASIITRRGATQSHSTLNRELAQLSRIFSLAIEWGKLEVNPCKRVRRFPKTEGRKRVLTPDEESRILEALKPYPVMTQVVRLALQTGMRRGEIFKMKIEDLNFEMERDLRGKVLSYGEIRLPGQITKSGKPRTIPMTSEAREILEPIIGEPFQKVIRGLSMGTASHLFRMACKQAHVIGAVLHSLRHTFGSRLSARNVPQPVIMELLGHSSTQMTDIYTHPDDRSKQSAVQSLSVPSGEVHDIGMARKTANERNS